MEASERTMDRAREVVLDEIAVDSTLSVSSLVVGLQEKTTIIVKSLRLNNIDAIQFCG